MRNTDERVKAAILGAKKIKRKRKQRCIKLTLSVCSLCLIIFFSMIIPNLINNVNISLNTTDFTASIFENNASLPYIIIGIVSFVLGVAFTTLCIMLKKKGDQEDDDN